MLYKDYSFYQLNTKFRWCCSQRKGGCNARVKLDKKGRLTVINEKAYFFTTDQGKTLLMFQKYTFSYLKSNGRVMTCSRRWRGKCGAQINIDKNGKIVVIKGEHNHPPPIYKKMQNGKYTKL